MNLLTDIFPIILFVLAYQYCGIYIATGAAIVASIIQVGIYWFRHKRVEPMHLLTLALIVIFGGSTLYFHNEIFIKWKPTVLNWILAIAFLASHYISEKPVIQKMMEKNISLPRSIWVRLNWIWVSFFFITGAANLFVAYHFDTSTWVKFKLFGMLGFTILFVIGQAVYLTKHAEPESGTTPT